MSASDTMTQPKDRPADEAYWLAPGEGAGAFESFFTDTFPRATEGSSPADGQPDLERMAEAAARYGVTILGPPPGQAAEGSRSDG